MTKYICKVCGRALKTKGWLTRHSKKWSSDPLGIALHKIAHGAFTERELRALARKFDKLV